MTPGLPLTLAWSPAPSPGRTLFVVFAYHGADRDAQPSRVPWRWESAAARGHRIVHRDHYANPRSLQYLVGLVGEASALLSPDRAPDLVVDARFGAELPDRVTRAFGRVVVAEVASRQAWTRDLLGESRAYDHVVLVYADALGLGCEAGERSALADRDDVLVINGRRRAFRLDRRLRRRLALSRLLARTRIVEEMLSVLVRPFAGTLALWDRLVSKRF